MLEVCETITNKHDLRNVSIPFGVCSYGCTASNLFRVFGPGGCKHPVVVGDGCVKSATYGESMSIPLVGDDVWRTGSSESTMEALEEEETTDPLLVEDKQEWSDVEDPQGLYNLTKSTKRKRVASAKKAAVDLSGVEEEEEDEEAAAAAAAAQPVVSTAGKRGQKKK